MELIRAVVNKTPTAQPQPLCSRTAQDNYALERAFALIEAAPSFYLFNFGYQLSFMANWNCRGS